MLLLFLRIFLLVTALPVSIGVAYLMQSALLSVVVRILETPTARRSVVRLNVATKQCRFPSPAIRRDRRSGLFF